MTTQRIKWKKTKDEHVSQSCRTFTSLSTKANYDVYINYKDITFKIVNLSGRGNFYGGEGINNVEVLQRHIRKKLKKLGVDLSKEIRQL